MKPRPTRKHVLGVSEDTYFHDFRHMFQGQFWDPHFIDCSSTFIGLGIPFWHLGDGFLGTLFRSEKNYRFTFPSWGEAILDPTGRRGYWKASGRHLGGAPSKEIEEGPEELCESSGGGGPRPHDFIKLAEMLY